MNRAGNVRAFVVVLASSLLPIAYAQAPPTVSKTFAAPTVALGSTTTMTLTLTNPSTLLMTNLKIADTLPNGLQFVGAPGSSFECSGTQTVGASALSATVISLNAGVSCTISIKVLGTAVGGYVNTTGSPTGVIGVTTFTGNPASASLQVTAAVLPTVSKAFAAPTVALGSTTTMTLTLTNPSNVAMTNLSIADTLPGGLQFVGSPGSSFECSGTQTVLPATLTATVITLGPGVSCTISIKVLGTAVGSYVNTTGSPTGVIGATTFTGNPASASLQVTAAVLPSVSKSFAAPTVAFGSTTTMTLTLTNPSNVAMTNLSIADTLPSGLQFVGSPATSFECSGTQTVLPATLTATVITLAPGVSCTISIKVLGTAVGAYLNTTGSPTGVIGATTFTGSPASASLQVTAAVLPTVSKVFAATTIAVGASTTMTLTLTNPSNVAMTNLTIVDTLPSGLQFVGPPGSSFECSGTQTVLPATLTATVITLGPGVSCTISIKVLGVTAGAYLNTTSAPTGVIGATTFTGNPASAYLQVGPLAPPVLTKSFTPAQISIAGTTVIAFTLTNPNISAMTNVAFTDALPAGLIVSLAPNTSTTCGGTVTAVSNATSISFTGGSMPAIGSCTVTVTLQATTPGTKTNTTGNVTGVVNAQTLQGNPATATLVVDASTVSFLIRYASNLAVGDSVVNFTNSGTSSTLSFGANFAQNGEICANVFAYSPDEQLVSCCSCNVTPNALNSLNVKADLGTNTLTPVIPSSLVIKVIATAGGTACTAASAPQVNTAVLQPGLEAWGTTLHALPVAGGTAAGTYGLTETPFSKARTSPAELDRMAQLCAFIRANGSGYGICKSCKVGGLGASAK